MSNKNFKSILKKILSKLGIEVKRIEKTIQEPTFYENAKQALLFSQGGKASVFSCPVHLCTHYTGIGFESLDWNPFIETLKEFEENPLLVYEDSILYKFYTSWLPNSAAEAIMGFQNSPEIFSSYSPHYLFLSPWSSLTYSEVDRDTRLWNYKDNIEHGCSHLHFPKDGWTFFGPVHSDKGKLEFNRAINLFNSIKECGYDKTKGYIGVTQLKRKNEYRYLVGGGGYHRATVMAALGFEFLPARFHRNSTVDIRDVNDWPQVRNGLWTRNQALDYVDHLFDFSSRKWVSKINLIK